MAQVGLEPWPFTSQTGMLNRAEPAGQPVNRLQNSLMNHIWLKRICITLWLYIRTWEKFDGETTDSHLRFDSHVAEVCNYTTYAVY